MGLVMYGGGVSQISGKVGGVVFSRGAGGAIIRKHTKPINPRSARQNVVRSNVAYLTTYWSKTLTEQQRTDWRAYVAGTTWTNRLGQTIQINGLAAFVRVNTLRLLAGLDLIAAAPLAMGHAGGVTISFTAYSDTGKLNVAEPVGAFDKSTDDHELLIFSGLPTEAGRISATRGFRFIQVISGNATTPPTFPLELTAPFTMQEGQLITMRAMFTDENFRASGPYFANTVAVPST